MAWTYSDDVQRILTYFIAWMWQEEELHRKAQKEAEAERAERVERQKRDEQSNLDGVTWYVLRHGHTLPKRSWYSGQALASLANLQGAAKSAVTLHPSPDPDFGAQQFYGVHSVTTGKTEYAHKDGSFLPYIIFSATATFLKSSL